MKLCPTNVGLARLAEVGAARFLLAAGMRQRGEPSAASVSTRVDGRRCRGLATCWLWQRPSWKAARAQPGVPHSAPSVGLARLAEGVFGMNLARLLLCGSETKMRLCGDGDARAGESSSTPAVPA